MSRKILQIFFSYFFAFPVTQKYVIQGLSQHSEFNAAAAGPKYQQPKAGEPEYFVWISHNVGNLQF